MAMSDGPSSSISQAGQNQAMSATQLQGSTEDERIKKDPAVRQYDEFILELERMKHHQ